MTDGATQGPVVLELENCTRAKDEKVNEKRGNQIEMRARDVRVSPLVLA